MPQSLACWPSKGFLYCTSFSEESQALAGKPGGSRKECVTGESKKGEHQDESQVL